MIFGILVKIAKALFTAGNDGGWSAAHVGENWRHFKPNEFYESQAASRHNIPNIPNRQQWINIDNLVINVLDPLREDLDRPININSGYRSPKVNAIIGGSKNSQHMRGEAADIKVAGMSAADVFNYIRENDKYLYDQLILEHGLVHISHAEKNRRQAKMETINKEYIDV